MFVLRAVKLGVGDKCSCPAFSPCTKGGFSSLSLTLTPWGRTRKGSEAISLYDSRLHHHNHGGPLGGNNTPHPLFCFLGDSAPLCHSSWRLQGGILKPGKLCALVAASGFFVMWPGPSRAWTFPPLSRIFRQPWDVIPVHGTGPEPLTIIPLPSTCHSLLLAVLVTNVVTCVLVLNLFCFGSGSCCCLLSLGHFMFSNGTACSLSQQRVEIVLDMPL